MKGYFPPYGWCEMRGEPEVEQRTPGSATRWTPPFVPDIAEKPRTPVTNRPIRPQRRSR